MCACAGVINNHIIVWIPNIVFLIACDLYNGMAITVHNTQVQTNALLIKYWLREHVKMSTLDENVNRLTFGPKSSLKFP